jgi:hypothetical protein
MTVQFHTVTWYSRILALIFFLAVLPVWTFYISIQYQKTVDQLEYKNNYVEYKKNPSTNQLNQIELPSTHSELVRVKTEGGLCQTGLCVSEVVVYTDGLVEVVSPVKKTRTISKSKVENLKKEIDTTDFKKIMAVPFTDVCPMAYDGNRVTYTFYTSRGIKNFDSCTVSVDVSSRLFSTLLELLDEGK